MSALRRLVGERLGAGTGVAPSTMAARGGVGRRSRRLAVRGDPRPVSC